MNKDTLAVFAAFFIVVFPQFGVDRIPTIFDFYTAVNRNQIRSSSLPPAFARDPCCLLQPSVEILQHTSASLGSSFPSLRSISHADSMQGRVSRREVPDVTKEPK